MNATDLFAALDLPASARVDQRVPKKLLVENGAPTAIDKRRINEGIEEIQWLAALKPTTIGVPEYRDEAREYLEIAVLSVTLRADAKAERLAELVHRAVPYPVFLVLVQGTGLSLSLAHKRWAQNEAGKVVLEGDVAEVELASQPQSTTEVEQQFLAALSLTGQPRFHLLALYQGWMDTLLAVQAARLTGTFSPAATAEHAAARSQALRDCARLETQIATLRTAAAREKQMARQVELNLELKRAQAQLADTRTKL